MRLKTLLAGCAALALGAALLSRYRTREEAQPTAAAEDPEKQRIRTFWALFNQANSYRLRGEFRLASSGYRDSLKLDPKHEDSLYYLGTSLEELGDYAGAAATFRRMLELNPASARALSELANVLASTDPAAPADYRAAQAAVVRLVEVNREQSGPFLRMGLLDLDQGRLEDALQNFRLAEGFGAPEGHYWVAYTLYLQGKYTEAIQPLKKVLDLYARDRKLIGRGVLSEGDLWPAPGKPLTALEKAALKSMILLRWCASAIGGFPPSVPIEFRFKSRPGPEIFAGARHLQFLFSPARPFNVNDAGPSALALTGQRRSAREESAGFLLASATAIRGVKTTGAAWQAYSFDYDGDGRADLYIVRPGFRGEGQNQLFQNRGDGTFADATQAAGLAGKRSTTRACVADFSGAGRLDLVEVGAGDETHTPLRFFRNSGKGFLETTRDAALATSGTAVDCAVGDYDGDGKPDLFVLYWKREARLFRNLGNGKFADVTEQAGLGALRGHGFRALFFDYNRDGLPDLLITEHAPFEHVARCLLEPGYKATAFTPHLFRNLKGRFEDVTERAGLARCYGTMDAVAVDLDGDGWTDLVLANGSLNAERLEPTVVLQNIEGKEFREWFYLPAFDKPTNVLGASLRASSGSGPQALSFSLNPLIPRTARRKPLKTVP